MTGSLLPLDRALSCQYLVIPDNQHTRTEKRDKNPHVLSSFLALEICRNVKVPENDNTNKHIS